MGKPPGLDPEGINVAKDTINGLEWWVVEWKIVQVQKRMKESLGNAIVSPPFLAGEIEQLRLMFTPIMKDNARRNEDSYHKMVSETPKALLNLKIDCNFTVQYFFTVGRGTAQQQFPRPGQGPHVHNFAKSTVTEHHDELALGLKDKIDTLDKSLVVGVKIRIESSH